jgi:hypothetical protein
LIHGLTLSNCGHSCLQQSRLELRYPHPPEERFGRDPNGAGSLLRVSLSEQGSNGFFLLTPEFCAMTGHLDAPEDSFVG